MWCQLRILVFSITSAVAIYSRRDIFEENADSLVKDIIGDIELERDKWTTPDLDMLEEQLMKITRSTNRLLKTTVRRDANKASIPFSPEKLSLEEVKTKIRLQNLMTILDDNTRPNLNFDEGIDDPAQLTRRYDHMKTQFRRRYYRIRKHNIWRNQTIQIMDHFMHAVRYKLPHAQLLRKKYYDALRYRMGYCFGLLSHLKRQQMYVYNNLQFFHNKVFYLHFHMRSYEKVVRLDVDIKDVIRTIRTIESRRRVLSDPKYYDLYYDMPTVRTRPTTTAGVQEVKIDEATMANMNDRQKAGDASPRPSGGNPPAARRYGRKIPFGNKKPKMQNLKT